MVVEFPLHFMHQGERGRIAGIRWREADVAQRLVEMGFARGATFEVVAFDPSRGITVRISGRDVTLVPWVAPAVYATEDPPAP
ncbi:MAG: FeoA family protein [Gemmatimonadota bacterium]